MIDFKNGILEIEGYQISRESKLSDFEGIDPSVAKTHYFDIDGTGYLKFKNYCMESAGVAVRARVEFFTTEKPPKIILYPKTPQELQHDGEAQSEFMLSASKKWLKTILDVPAASDRDDGIVYEFKWGYILSHITKDREWGLVGGEVIIGFNEG